MLHELCSALHPDDTDGTAGVSVQGKSVSIPTGDDALSAIDTGTTLIGGPSSAVTAIYGAIDGAQPLGGSMQGFWAFRKLFSSSL